MPNIFRRPGTCIIQRMQDRLVACCCEKVWCEGEDYEPKGRACRDCIEGRCGAQQAC